jgi:transitional endoplasmic reticulum ATPase
LAKEANLTLIHVQCPQLLSKFVGDSEAGLRDVFRTARAMAPSLLLLDDIDSIARARSGLEVRLAAASSSEEGNTINSMNTIATSHSSGSNAVLERLLSTLLNELDGIGLRASSSSSSSSMHHLPILVVGTCAASSTLDAALLRSGRLELHVFVHSPEPSDRLAILKASARKVKLSSSACEYLEELSRSDQLYKWSAAKISTIIKEAANFSIQDDTQELKIEYLKRVINGDVIMK